jgi:hypothetical protein
MHRGLDVDRVSAFRDERSVHSSNVTTTLTGQITTIAQQSESYGCGEMSTVLSGSMPGCSGIRMSSGGRGVGRSVGSTWPGWWTEWGNAVAHVDAPVGMVDVTWGVARFREEARRCPWCVALTPRERRRRAGHPRDRTHQLHRRSVPLDCGDTPGIDFRDHRRHLRRPATSRAFSAVRRSAH